MKSVLEWQNVRRKKVHFALETPFEKRSHYDQTSKNNSSVIRRIGNIATVYKLLSFPTRHKGNWTEGCGDPLNMSEVVKCEYSNRTKKQNVDLEGSTFFFSDVSSHF